MRITLSVFTLSILLFLGANAQDNKCGFDAHIERMLAEDPSAFQTITEVQQQAEEIGRQHEEGDVERGGGPRIIPTVFHVIHQGGAENISYAQIEDQIRILNEDYQRLNEDTVNTRPVFQGVASNPNVEFRLAKLDPQGNCTDGVVRVWSPLTYNASDNNGVKGVSYWNSSKYFNVWVVATIDPEGESGTVLGYAQFPGIGSAQTDGVVVRADYVGNIGTGASNGSNGRTLTHEAGHWLGLFHTFQGGCNGGFFDDGCDDTPPQNTATQSNCPQNANTCTNDNPDLPDQVENYMDYSNGACQNMFTLDQKSRMEAVLSGSRSNIHSLSNLNATGVLLGETPCAPKAQFFAEKTVVCAGQSVTFTDNSYNGEVTTYDWQLTGATPASSSSQNPVVVYNTPGVYSVTLNVSNAEGSNSSTQTNYITVIPGTAQVSNWFAFEGFEEVEEDYIIISDNLGATWEESNTAFTDNKSIYLNNFSGNPAGSEDEFQLASVDMTQINDAGLYFRLSYKQRNSDRADNLRVYASRDCGETWTLRYNKSGSALSTVSGVQGSSFTPSSQDDWELITVNMSAFADDEHVLVKFRGTSDAGNNIYIDDIQLSGPLGVSNEQEDFEFAVVPNPLSENGQVIVQVANTANYSITLMDVTGKTVADIHNGTLTTGSYKFPLSSQVAPSSGIYMVQIQGQSGKQVRKVVVQ